MPKTLESKGWQPGSRVSSQRASQTKVQSLATTQSLWPAPQGPQEPQPSPCPILHSHSSLLLVRCPTSHPPPSTLELLLFSASEVTLDCPSRPRHRPGPSPLTSRCCRANLPLASDPYSCLCLLLLPNAAHGLSCLSPPCATHGLPLPESLAMSARPCDLPPGPSSASPHSFQHSVAPA